MSYDVNMAHNYWLAEQAEKERVEDIMTNYPANRIFLNIIRKWHQMILYGPKREEYRALTRRYAKRLLCKRDYELFCELEEAGLLEYLQHVDLEPKEGREVVTLRNGYAGTDPTTVHELKGIKVKHPNPAWCPPNTQGLWFALELGEVIKTENV